MYKNWVAETILIMFSSFKQRKTTMKIKKKVLEGILSKLKYTFHTESQEKLKIFFKTLIFRRDTGSSEHIKTLIIDAHS